MPYTIYLRRNKINGMGYVGQTQKSIEERWQNGRGYVPYRGSLLGQAIQEYGRDAFEHITLCVVETKAEADEMERKYILEFNTLEPNGYNTTTGGQSGYKPSQRYKEKMRSSSPHQLKSEEFKRAMSERMKKRWQDPAYRAATEKTLKENSIEIAANKDKYYNEDRKALMSKIAKERWQTADAAKREKMLSGFKKKGVM